MTSTRPIKERVSKPGLDLATNREIVENLHLAASEPEAVSYAEVDADGVPAPWCIPQGSDPARVLLHSHSGGSVVTSRRFGISSRAAHLDE